MRHREAKRLKCGDVVWTETTSGSPICCTVTAEMDGMEYANTYEPGTLFLDSPSHGYEIGRHYTELRKA